MKILIINDLNLLVHVIFFRWRGHFSLSSCCTCCNWCTSHKQLMVSREHLLILNRNWYFKLISFEVQTQQNCCRKITDIEVENTVVQFMFFIVNNRGKIFALDFAMYFLGCERGSFAYPSISVRQWTCWRIPGSLEAEGGPDKL